MTLIDLRESPPTPVIETDVCVIGAGAAGITVATELDRAGGKSCCSRAAASPRRRTPRASTI
jgi:cation diffusion facilitator CzcD-associated flavoprotein CzcO